MTAELFFQFSAVGMFAAAWSFTLQSGEIFARIGDLFARLPLWLNKPLGLCEKCFAGQIALWSGIWHCYTSGWNNLYLLPLFIGISITFSAAAAVVIFRD